MNDKGLSFQYEQTDVNYTNFLSIAYHIKIGNLQKLDLLFDENWRDRMQKFIYVSVSWFTHKLIYTGGLTKNAYPCWVQLDHRRIYIALAK